MTSSNLRGYITRGRAAPASPMPSSAGVPGRWFGG